MADEVQKTEKSIFPNLGILSSSSLEGLSPDVQDQLQRDATKRIALGGLLSGGNFGLAFQSAVGTPNDYMQNQSRLMELKEKQRQQQELDAFRQTYQPRPIDAASRAMAGGGPTLSAAQNQQRILNTPLDIDAALQSTLGMAGNTAQPRIVENLKAMQTQFRPETGEQVTPGGRTVGVTPLSDKSGMQRSYDPVTKQWTFSAAPGATEAISALTTAEKGAAAKFELKPVFENGQQVLRPVYKLSGEEEKAALDRAKGDVAALKREISLTKPTETGRLAILNQELQKAQSQATSFGGPTSPPVSQLSAPEAAYQGGWEKIRDNAYKGYEIATGRSGTLQSLQNIMNRPDFDTNAFTNYKTQLAGVLKASGIANEQQKQFLNSAAGFRQGLNTIAAQSVSELSGSTSNFDLEFSQSRFATITDPKQANQYAIDLMAASDARKKDFYNYVQNNRTPDVTQKWQQTEQGKASIFETPSMRKYLPSSQVIDGPYKGQTAYKMPDGTVKVFPK